MTRVHRIAAAGFEAAADAYEQGRPDYPAAAIDWLAQELRIGRSSRVVDLGAGTGKLTRLLKPTGAKLIAVEPLAAMRQKLAELLPEVQTVDATAEALPLPAASADAVLAGQAFHWFCNAKAVEAIHCVLKPGGRLGLIWNYRDVATPWVAELQRIIDRLERQVPSYRTGEWRQVFAAKPLFGPLHERTFEHTQTGDLETMLARVTSMSYVATLPPERRQQVLDEVRQLFAALPQPIVFPYTTHAYWCERIG